ncbi:hypothetical protein DI392_16465 [Vibrio albus]|uniref:Cytochrome c domain-containing protein n=1 Tax=Vibrio albus TaxID=2200953 RepID=A0A2U3B6B7_9VIBR|nr:c-type cytochrome [Vibrio albus]PWI32265.1 hypothetical protein DI392_16465 [Vibrio albus]
MKKLLTRIATVIIFSASMSTIVQAEEASVIARGGQLYDKWFKVIDAPKPADTHKAWPASNTKKKGDVTWRCKSCHGWDLRGKDGAYSKGSYKTGIKGLQGVAGAPLEEIITVMKDDTHGMEGMMNEQDYHDLALFVSKGQVDMSSIINPDKSVNGDVAKGEAYYNTICAGCHGKDGKLPRDLAAPLGKIVSSNPWEGLFKILNGQPKESMPAMRALPIDVSTDILSYMMTLPQK